MQKLAGKNDPNLSLKNEESELAKLFGDDDEY